MATRQSLRLFLQLPLCTLARYSGPSSTLRCAASPQASVILKFPRVSDTRFHTATAGHSDKGYVGNLGGDNQQDYMERTLFVSGLHARTENAQLRLWCEEMGVRVSRITRPVNRFSLCGNRYCFLRLDQDNEVSNAVALLNREQLLIKRRFRVRPATVIERDVFAAYRYHPSPYFPNFERDYSLADVNRPIEEERVLFVGGFPKSSPSIPLQNKVDGLLGGKSTVEAMSHVKQTQLKKHWEHWELGVFVIMNTGEDAASAIASLNEKEEDGHRLKVRLVCLDTSDAQAQSDYELLRARGKRIDVVEDPSW